MCFIPKNIHNELFNGVRQFRWQHLSPVVSTFSTSIRLLSSFFTKHCILPLSFSISLSLSAPLSLFFFCGTPSLFLISSFSLRFQYCHPSMLPPSGNYCIETALRAVDNALTLFRVWPIENVGAILVHANAAAYADNMNGC